MVPLSLLPEEEPKRRSLGRSQLPETHQENQNTGNSSISRILSLEFPGDWTAAPKGGTDDRQSGLPSNRSRWVQDPKRSSERYTTQVTAGFAGQFTARRGSEWTGQWKCPSATTRSRFSERPRKRACTKPGCRCRLVIQPHKGLGQRRGSMLLRTQSR